MENIPPPTCPFGYTTEDLNALFPTEEEMVAFNKWMYGQTMSICEGRTYNHEEGVYETTTCADHLTDPSCTSGTSSATSTDSTPWSTDEP